VLEQIDVAVNAPEAGTIKEFLANEEDTVTVGQDLVRLELGGAPAGEERERGSSEPKEATPKEQSTSSDPDPSKKDEPKPNQESSSPPTKEEKPAAKDTPKPKPGPKKSESTSSSSSPSLGNREERRVSIFLRSSCYECC